MGVCNVLADNSIRLSDPLSERFFLPYDEHFSLDIIVCGAYRQVFSTQQPQEPMQSAATICDIINE